MGPSILTGCGTVLCWAGLSQALQDIQRHFPKQLKSSRSPPTITGTSKITLLNFQTKSWRYFHPKRSWSANPVAFDKLLLTSLSCIFPFPLPQFLPGVTVSLLPSPYAPLLPFSSPHDLQLSLRVLFLHMRSKVMHPTATLSLRHRKPPVIRVQNQSSSSKTCYSISCTYLCEWHHPLNLERTTIFVSYSSFLSPVDCIILSICPLRCLIFASFFITSSNPHHL